MSTDNKDPGEVQIGLEYTTFVSSPVRPIVEHGTFSSWVAIDDLLCASPTGWINPLSRRIWHADTRLYQVSNSQSKQTVADVT